MPISSIIQVLEKARSEDTNVSENSEQNQNIPISSLLNSNNKDNSSNKKRGNKKSKSTPEPKTSFNDIFKDSITICQENDIEMPSSIEDNRVTSSDGTRCRIRKLPEKF